MENAIIYNTLALSALYLEVGKNSVVYRSQTDEILKPVRLVFNGLSLIAFLSYFSRNTLVLL